MQTLTLTDRVALISGGAGDIGLAIAAACVEAGARVALLDNDAPALAARVAARFGRDERVMPIECDVADPQQTARAVDAVIARWQRLQILVNNAAASTPSAPVGAAEVDDWRRALDVNVTGAWLLARAAIPAMAAGGGGVVLNVASQLGHVAVAGRGVYGVSKAALIALSRSIAVDHAAEGIRSVSVSPGAVMTTRLTTRYGSAEQASAALAPRYPLARIGNAAEIARVVAFLASDAASFVTGCDWLVDGGYTAL